MSTLSTFRNQFDLSTSVFSEMLQCHRTQLTMAESGQRSLPQQSKTILRHLEQAFETFVPTETSNGLSSDETIFLQKQVKNCIAQLAMLTLEKEKITDKIAAAIKLQQLLLALKSFPLPAKAADAQLQIQILERKLPAKLKKLQLEMAKIQLKMGALQGEIDAANALLL